MWLAGALLLNGYLRGPRPLTLSLAFVRVFQKKGAISCQSLTAWTQTLQWYHICHILLMKIVIELTHFWELGNETDTGLTILVGRIRKNMWLSIINNIY
jgi:hypothetical protein